MAQLEQLQARLVEMQDRLSGGASAAGELPLDQRLALLRRRVRRHATRTEPSAGSHPNAPLSGRAAQLRNSLVSQRKQLDELPESLQVATYGASRLAEVAVDALDDAAGDVSKQLHLLPAMEEVARRLAELLAAQTEEQRRRREIETLVRSVHLLHCRVLTGVAVEKSELFALAREVMKCEESLGPGLFEESRLSSEWAVACHCLNVARVVCLLTGKEVRWRAFRDQMAVAALMVDVGLTPTPERTNAVTTHAPEHHPLAAEKFLQEMLDPQFVQAAAAHHERLDGSGFPRGLGGEDLAPPARLLAAVDHYCRLQSRFQNPTPVGPREALLATLREAENGLLDPVLTRQLLSIGLYPVGTYVELSTGEIAEVVATHEAADAPMLASLPVVRLLPRWGQVQAKPVFRNLAQRPDCRIIRALASVEVEEFVSG